MISKKRSRRVFSFAEKSLSSLRVDPLGPPASPSCPQWEEAVVHTPSGLVPAAVSPPGGSRAPGWKLALPFLVQF